MLQKVAAPVLGRSAAGDTAVPALWSPPRRFLSVGKDDAPTGCHEKTGGLSQPDSVLHHPGGREFPSPKDRGSGTLERSVASPRFHDPGKSGHAWQERQRDHQGTDKLRDSVMPVAGAATNPTPREDPRGLAERRGSEAPCGHDECYHRGSCFWP